ncbi:MAG: methylmalonyl-CoA mutase family protein, partial [Fidelibacterota bacterium]
MKIDLTKFEIPDIDSWKNQVLKETKDESAFVYENELENIKIDTSNKNLDPGSYSTSNFQDEWDIVSSFKITESFKNNQALIQCLEHGSNHLYLEIYDKNPSWDKIFSNIRIEIIHVTIAFRSKGQIESFKSYLPQQLETFISISIDPFEMEYYELFKDSGVSFCIDGFSIEQIGASSNQQLAMVIYCGEYILQQCKNQHRIKFQLGIGSDFLIETSKIRAFKWIWQHVLDENNYQDNQIHIIGTIGWTNKSIKDPHMNLLRHTTEGLSALSGGVSGLLIHPANELSNLESNWFDMRMALNI